jgi:amino acid adenylation domain-containing protein
MEAIADRFEMIARAQPGRQAVSADGQQASYGELAAHAARIASRLLRKGVQQGDRIALYFEHGPAALAAWLGVLKSGAIAVPLVPTHPVERLRLLVSDASAWIVLSEFRSLEKAAAVAAGFADVLDVDAVGDETQRACPRVGPADPATILYTSGTSGKPKGVIQTHGNILKKVDVCAAAFATTPSDRFSLLTWCAMAQGTIVTASALLSGATLCTFNVRQEGLSGLADWIVRERISIYVSVSSLFRSLARTLEPARRFPDVRVVRIGGERVTVEDVEACRRLFPQPARLLVSYAATEAGPISLHEIGDGETFPDGVVPAGKALDGVTVLVCDEHGGRLPDGDQGELVVRSAFLSPGYWGQPAETARAFTASNNASGEREYRTGDLGRIRGGRIEHLGRIGHRVQIGGLRIELEEIESALYACPGVLRAAALAKPRGNDELQVVAYIQPLDGCRPTVDTMRASLGTRLPEQMIPSQFVFLKDIPLGGSGKIDRQRLPDPGAERPTLSSDWAEPVTPTERAVAEVVCDVLGIARVGREDAFLSLGGDSLRAGQVASRLGKRFGKQVSLGDLLSASTVAKIAALVEP